MLFDPVTLRAFLTLVDAGSIRAASESLHLSPSAVSRRLSDLERDVGQTFFVRHSRGLEITEAGQMFARRMRDVFETFDLARAELRRLGSGNSGNVSVGANGSAFVNGLTEHLRTFSETYPHVSIQLYELLSPDVVSALIGGKIELGLISKTFRLPPEIESHHYFNDRLMLAVNNKHPLAAQGTVTLTDIASFNNIGVNEGSSISQLLRRVSALGKASLAYNYVASTNEIVRTLVAHGHGIAVLPEQFILPYTPLLPVTALTIAESWAYRENCIICRKDRGMSPTARLMFDFLLSKERS